MIPAIDSGIGLKEDRPLPRVSPQGGPGFSQALQRARGDDARAERKSALADARASGDLRAREQYGKAARAAEDDGRATGPKGTGTKPTEASSADARNTGAEDAAAEADDSTATQAAPTQAASDASDSQPDEGDDLATTAGVLPAAAVQATLQPSQPLTEVAADPAIGAAVLQAVDPGKPPQSLNDATPITAQIGAAAYRLGDHSEAEAKLAEARGIVLPGSTQEQMQGQGLRDVKVATMQETDPDLAEADLDPAPVSGKDLVEPSKVAQQDRERGVSYREQIALQTAQNRNEVLARIAAGAEGDAALEGGAALRRQMQAQGLLARSARSHAVEPAAPSAPSTLPTGLGTPANSVALTQVFETPQDDAVQNRVLDRVATEARWLIRNDRQEVSLKLSPEHLGSLHMKVTHQDGQFRVDLTVDNLSAKHLLESNLQDLRNRLMTDNPGGEFLFNVDVRQGNQQPSLYSQAARDPQPDIRHIAALEQTPGPGLAGRVLGQSGLSIYA